MVGKKLSVRDSNLTMDPSNKCTIEHMPKRPLLEKVALEAKVVSGVDYLVFTPGNPIEPYKAEVMNMSCMQLSKFVHIKSNRNRLFFILYKGTMRLQSARLDTEDKGFIYGAYLRGNESVEEMAEAVQKFYVSSEGGEKWCLYRQQ